MSIILVRHGETLLNAARAFQPFDTELGPRGLEQARYAAYRIAEYAPAAILASDMPRAYRTAQAIAQQTGLTPSTTPLLHERNFGDWRGQSHATIGVDPNTFSGTPPGGESNDDFYSRVEQAFILAVGLRSKLSGPLVVVSHGLVIQTILQRCVQLGKFQMPQRIANTSVTLIDAHAPYCVHELNCTRHLDGTDVTEDAKSLSGG